MATADTIKSFLIDIGYEVDETSQRKFLDAVVGITKSVTELGGAVAAAAAGVVTAVSNMADNMERMYYLSQRTGSSVKDLDAFAFAMSKLGSSSDEAKQAVASFSQWIQSNYASGGILHAITGLPPGTDPVTYIRALATHFQELAAKGQLPLAQSQAQMMGLSGIFQTLLHGGDQLEQFINQFYKTADQAGANLDDMARRSRDLQNSYRDLYNVLNTITNVILDKFQPGLKAVIDGLQAFFTEHAGEITAFANRLGEAFTNWAVHFDFNKFFNDLWTDLQETWRAFGPLRDSMREMFAEFQRWIDEHGGWSGIWKEFQADFKILTADIREFLKVAHEIIHALGGWKTAGEIFFGIWAASKFAPILGAVGSLIGGLGRLVGIAFRLGEATRIFFSLARVIATLVGGVIGGPEIAAAILGWSIYEMLPEGAKDTLHEWTHALVDLVNTHLHLGRIVSDLAGLVKGVFQAAWKEALGWISGAIDSIGQRLGGILGWFQHLGGAGGGAGGGGGTPGPTAGSVMSGVGNMLGRVWRQINPIGSAGAAEPDEAGGNLAGPNGVLGDVFGAGGGFGAFGIGGSTFFNQMGAAGAVGPPTAGQRAGLTSDVAKHVIQFFEGKGWSLAQAAGIAANLYQESGFNPHAVGDNGQAYGVAQWHRDRQANFARLYGHPIQQSTMDEQLGFMDWELRNSEMRAGDMLMRATDAQSAVNAVLQSERPANMAREMALRGQFGQTILGAFQGMDATNNTTNNMGDRSLTQNNNITVNGSADPRAASNAVRDQLDRSYGDLINNTAMFLQ